MNASEFVRNPANRPWRCLACNVPFGRDFLAEKPVCPRCKLEPPAVVPRVFVHLVVADETGPLRGSGGRRMRFVCQPERGLWATGYPATEDPRAVTCPCCRDSDAYRTLRDAYTEFYGQPFDLPASELVGLD